jgi:hypothetical protein
MTVVVLGARLVAFGIAWILRGLLVFPKYPPESFEKGRIVKCYGCHRWMQEGFAVVEVKANFRGGILMAVRALVDFQALPLDVDKTVQLVLCLTY